MSGIISSAAAFLMAVARQDAGVQVNGPTVSRHPLPTPRTQMPKDPLHIAAIEPFEKSCEGRNAGDMAQPKHRTQCLVVTNQRCLSKSNAAGPHGHQKALHYHDRAATSITSGLRQWRCS